MSTPTPIRMQLTDVMASVEEGLGDEMVLSAVVIVRTKKRIQTFNTTNEPFYELLGMLEVAKDELIEEALER